MQTRDPATTSHLTARRPIAIRHLVWIIAKNKATRATETIGFWSGPDHVDISIDGAARTYYGAGDLVKIDPITQGVGTDIRPARVELSAIPPEVELAIRGYNARGAQVELHRAIEDPATGAIVGTPVRKLKGWISKIDLTTGGEDGTARVLLSLVSNARAGTKSLPFKKSDESQKSLPTAIGPDRFFRFSALSGAVPVRWGE